MTFQVFKIELDGKTYHITIRPYYKTTGWSYEITDFGFYPAFTIGMNAEGEWSQYAGLILVELSIIRQIGKQLADDFRRASKCN